MRRYGFAVMKININTFAKAVLAFVLIAGKVWLLNNESVTTPRYEVPNLNFAYR